MRIDRITLAKFRCHRDRVFDFQPGGNILYGQNFQGKSSVLDAIQFALTGACRGTDEAGRGFASLTSDGSRPALRLESDHNGSLPDKSVLAAVIAPARFLDLPADRQQQIIMALSGGFPENRWGIRSMADLKDRHKDAVEKRRELKRTWKGEPVRPKGEEVTEERITEARELLTSLRTRRDGLLSTISASEAISGLDVDALRSEYRALETRIEADEAEHQAKVKAAEADATKAAKALAKGIKADEEKAATLLAKVAEHDTAILEMERLKARIEGGLEGLATLTAGTCPVAVGVACHLTENDLMSARSSAMQGLQHVNDDLDKITAERNKLMAAVKALDLETRRRQASNQTHQAKPAGPAGIESKRARLELLSLKIKDCLAAPLPINLPAAREELAAIDTRIAKGEEIIRNGEALRLEWKGYTIERENYEKGRAAIEQAEAEVAALAPDGALAVEAQEQARGGISQIVNQVMDTFGFDLAISTAPWGILARGRDPEGLSDSERILASAAIQYALAVTTGVNLVLVDRLEALDSEHRGAILEVIMGNPDVQWIMAFTVPSPDYFPPEIPGITWIQVAQMQEVAGVR
jgi:DNA repair exonuclease SbcCD ATPase subunit